MMMLTTAVMMAKMRGDDDVAITIMTRAVMLMLISATMR